MREVSTRVLQGTPNAVGLSGLDYLLSPDILHSFRLPLYVLVKVWPPNVSSEYDFHLDHTDETLMKCFQNSLFQFGWGNHSTNPHYSSLTSPWFTFAVGMSSRWASASRHPDCTTSRTRESIGSLWVCFLVSCSVTGKASITDIWIISTSSGLPSGPMLVEDERDRHSWPAVLYLGTQCGMKRHLEKGTNVVFLLLP